MSGGGEAIVVEAMESYFQQASDVNKPIVHLVFKGYLSASRISLINFLICLFLQQLRQSVSFFWCCFLCVFLGGF